MTTAGPACRRPGGKQIVPRPQNTSEEFEAPWPIGHRWSLDQLMIAVPNESAPIAPPFPDARPSSVLVALTDGPAGAEVLLTRRSKFLRNHRGEVCFPGGRCDPGETAIDTALREAHEEVGLKPAAVNVVGELQHLSTVVSKSYIVPVVGHIEERVELTPQSDEADRVFWLSLADLSRPGTYHAERWGRPPLDRLLHFFDLDDETVWGATAHMLVDLLTRVIDSRSG